MPKSTKPSAVKPAKESELTPAKVEEIKPVTIFANPKIEAEMKAAKRKPKVVTIETGKCYRFAKGEDVFYGKVVDFTQSTVDLKVFRNGEHSNVQTFDRKGLTAKEVSAEVAFNSSLNPDHNGG